MKQNFANISFSRKCTIIKLSLLKEKSTKLRYTLFNDMNNTGYIVIFISSIFDRRVNILNC